MDEQTKSYLTPCPNPTADNMYVLTSEDLSMAKVEIFDVQGRLVTTPSLHHSSVCVGDLQTGLYVIEITNLNTRHILRFMKQ